MLVLLRLDQLSQQILDLGQCIFIDSVQSQAGWILECVGDKGDGAFDVFHVVTSLSGSSVILLNHAFVNPRLTSFQVVIAMMALR